MPLLLLPLHRQVNQSPLHHPLLLLWPRHSATTPPPLLPMCPLGLLSTWAPETLSSGLASSQWYRQTNFVVCPVRMQVHTCNTSLSCATQSSSKTSHKLAPGSVCFPFPLWGKRNNGFIRRRKLSTRGTNVPWKIFAFPMGKTNALRGKISNFQQTSIESIPEAWERLQDYIQVCSHHGMKTGSCSRTSMRGLCPCRRGM